MLEEFEALYRVSPKVQRVKPQDTQEWKAFFTKKGSPVALTSIKTYLEQVPRYESFYPFFQECPILWMVPCDGPDGAILGFVLRGFRAKEYRTFAEKDTPQLMFGFHGFGDYQLGRPIVLVEGVKDQLSLARVYPYVLALLTSSVSVEAMQILGTLTRKIVLALDNDEVGRRQTIKLRKEFIGRGFQVQECYPIKKDWGDYFDSPGMEGEAATRMRAIVSRMG